jgi:hypothetical protein
VAATTFVGAMGGPAAVWVVWERRGRARGGGGGARGGGGGPRRAAARTGGGGDGRGVDGRARRGQHGGGDGRHGGGDGFEREEEIER